MRNARRSKLASKRTSEKTRRSRVAAALISLLLAPVVGCVNVVSGVPSRCLTIEEDPREEIITEQALMIFKPDEDDRPTRFAALADRLDYLEGRCYGINAFRGD